MENALPFVPPTILKQLANMKPFVLLVFYQGENYSAETTQQIIQGEHLPYLFDLREKGIVLLSMPVTDYHKMAAIAVYNLPDKESVQFYADQDPALLKKVFTYELLLTMGMKGDKLV